MKLFILLFIVILFYFPAQLHAERSLQWQFGDEFDEDNSINTSDTVTEVQTKIRAKASTGGNNASGTNASIQKGDASVSVQVQNTVNGEKQEPMHILVNSREEPKKVNLEKRGNGVKTQIEIEARAESNNILISTTTAQETITVEKSQALSEYRAKDTKMDTKGSGIFIHRVIQRFFHSILNFFIS